MNEQAQKLETPEQAALRLLDQAWAYYMPEPVVVATNGDRQEPQRQELFQYYAAA